MTFKQWIKLKPGDLIRNKFGVIFKIKKFIPGIPKIFSGYDVIQYNNGNTYFSGCHKHWSKLSNLDKIKLL